MLEENRRAEQAARGPGHSLGPSLAHRARADPDQRVPGEQEQAHRGQEDLPAAAEPVRESQRDQDSGRCLGADAKQHQQAAVLLK